MKTPVYQKLASLLQAIRNCEESGNAEWIERHKETIEKLVSEHMPSGSGFDNGTFLDLAQSDPEKLVFNASFHHMDDSGHYDGWTDHVATVESSLAHGIVIDVAGPDRNGINDYIGDVFQSALSADVGE